MSTTSNTYNESAQPTKGNTTRNNRAGKQLKRDCFLSWLSEWQGRTQKKKEPVITFSKN
jgi:hypothetical protein